MLAACHDPKPTPAEPAPSSPPAPAPAPTPPVAAGDRATIRPQPTPSGIGGVIGSEGGGHIDSAPIALGSPTVRGGKLDNLRAAFDYYSYEIADCYRERPSQQPAVVDHVIATFEVAPTGVVIASDVKGNIAEVDRCVAARLRTMHFGRPVGAAATVTLSIDLGP